MRTTAKAFNNRHPYSDFKAVDLVHLSRQTMGDNALEAEILALFVSQARIYVEAFAKADAQEGRKHAAHALKGAARAIGAFGLADLAENAETPGFSRIADLEAEANRVCDYIHVLID